MGKYEKDTILFPIHEWQFKKIIVNRLPLRRIAGAFFLAVCSAGYPVTVDPEAFESISGLFAT